jgi:hypothetical protein
MEKCIQLAGVSPCALPFLKNREEEDENEDEDDEARD